MASNTYNVADNGSRSRNRGIYIAVSLKTKFKGTCKENFTTVRECFGLGTAHVNVLGECKKEEEQQEEEENEDDETRFSPFSGSSL